MASRILYTDLMEYANDTAAQAAWVTDASGLEIDYMEYATDGAAQAAYVSNDAGNLQCYSENTIINQGTYSLKVVAAITDSLSDTLTKSGLSLDLTDKDELKLDVRANRTGTNLQVQLVNGAAPSWDLLNEDCSDISDWTDEDTGGAVSEVDPAGQFRFDTNISAASNYKAVRKINIGSSPNIITLEIKLYCDAIGTYADQDWFGISYGQADEKFDFRFASDGLFSRDTDAGVTEVGTNLVKHGGSAEWQTWRFLVTFTGTTGEGTCDVYLDDSTHNWEKVGTGIPCSYETAQEDIVYLHLYGYGTDDRIIHIDYIKLATGLYIPPAVTHTKDIAISGADAFETTTWDISGIANGDKDNITQIIFKILNADSATTYYIDNFRLPEDLQCYSEDTIKVQGDYSLKVLAAQTGSLNKTLTKTLTDYLDYSIQDVIKFDVRASRTGTNIQLQIHDTGGTTSTHNINIASANTWQTETWDISGITTTDRDTIDKIIIKVSEAAATNTIYMDNLYSQVIVESAHVFIGG